MMMQDITKNQTSERNEKQRKTAREIIEQYDGPPVRIMEVCGTHTHEIFRLVTAERAQKFENNYRKMIRIGFLAIAIIPLIFLILMFSLESKIVFLTLWIISIIAISVWLIVVEYIHTKLEEQKKLAGMSYEEMLENFRGKEAE